MTDSASNTPTGQPAHSGATDNAAKPEASLTEQQLSTVRVGSRLVHTPTQTEFTVLCNCPSSRPTHHTLRFVKQNKHIFALPTSNPATGASNGAS